MCDIKPVNVSKAEYFLSRNLKKIASDCILGPEMCTHTRFQLTFQDVLLETRHNFDRWPRPIARNVATVIKGDQVEKIADAIWGTIFSRR